MGAVFVSLHATSVRTRAVVQEAMEAPGRMDDYQLPNG
jgi:hypothetical protein